MSSPKDIEVGITSSGTYLSGGAVVGLGGNLANSAFYFCQFCKDSFSISRHFGQKSFSRFLSLQTKILKSSNKVPVLEDRGSLTEDSWKGNIN